MRFQRYRAGFWAISAAIALPLGITALSASSLVQMMHIARRVQPDWPHAEVVQMEARDHALLRAAWVGSPSFAGSCVMTLHGAGGWRARSHRFLPWLLDAGYSVLSPDSRAQGESGGDAITYGLLEQYDTLAWAGWMRSQGCMKLFGMGESMGASVLIMAAGLSAEERVFTAIVAECPFAELLEAAEDRGRKLVPLPAPLDAPLAKMAVAAGSLYVRWAEGLDFRQDSPLTSMARIDVPVLLIHGLADTTIPSAHSERLAAANPRYAELRLVPEARHVGAYTTAPAEFRIRVLELFATSATLSTK